jgi:hypothetical protein
MSEQRDTAAGWRLLRHAVVLVIILMFLAVIL